MIRKVLPIWVVLLVATILVRENPFFWDTVQLGSKHAHYFYETDFQSVILPAELDSGHPPLFGLYLALIWKTFGKTLAVSHFAMLPFLFGIGFYLLKIGEHWLGERRAMWLPLLCFADPVLASQCLLVSPDVFLACCFLMAVWAIVESKKGLLALAVVGLGLISTRGMMTAVALYVYALFSESKKLQPTIAFEKIIPFLPGGLVAAAYLFYHWYQTGWMGYHAASTWAPSFEVVDFKGLVKNIVVLGWRLNDFGRVFLWAVVLVLTYKGWRIEGWRILLKEKKFEQLYWLLALVFLALVPLQLFYKGLLAHRYLLPFFLIFNLFALVIAFRVRWPRKLSARRSALAIMLVLALVTGNFWRYPDTISTGWDSTLAHLPWYGLRGQVLDYLRENGIPREQVGATFPALGAEELHSLNGSNASFATLDLRSNCYVFYSNVMNDFSNAQIDSLRQSWPVVSSMEEGATQVVLFKNPDKEVCAN